MVSIRTGGVKHGRDYICVQGQVKALSLHITPVCVGENAKSGCPMLRSAGTLVVACFISSKWRSSLVNPTLCSNRSRIISSLEQKFSYCHMGIATRGNLARMHIVSSKV